MIERIRLLGLTIALVFALSPVTAAAQESLNSAEQDLPSASQPSPSLSYAALESPQITNLRSAADGGSVAQAIQSDDKDTPASPVAAAKGSGSGLGFMIAGGAALVGGLLIGGTGGNLIAAGGVALGVYGIIVYF
ncbi:MAG: hypothetical protein JJE01_06775 [Gemmatimonadetes bacterium]|nr:hypothetical protein [Gemmatimonadota bacterium]